jgi:hypothetical protein
MQIDACIFWSFFYRWEVGRATRRHDACFPVIFFFRWELGLRHDAN